MPDSLAAAAQLGIAIPTELGFPFRGIRFVGPGDTVASPFPVGQGLGVRRTVLHPLLVDAAANSGVQLLWGQPVTGIDNHRIQLRRGSVRARWMVGADGTQSMVRRWAGLSDVLYESDRFGFRRHYSVPPWSDYMEIHWSEGCQFYVTPVAANQVCVVLMSRDSHLRIEDTLPLFPALSEKLSSGRSAGAERGSYCATRHLRRVSRGHTALVGDASGTVDAISGQGLRLAFLQAHHLAAALEAGDLTIYETAHRRLTRRPEMMAGLMLTMDRSSWLRRRALRVLAERPQLFADLLAAHVGLLSFGQLAITAATLSWGIATA